MHVSGKFAVPKDGAPINDPIKVGDIDEKSVQILELLRKNPTLTRAKMAEILFFAAENLDKSSYCFMSCATTPKFTYDGFRLVGDKEIRDICPETFDRIKHLAYPEEQIKE